MKYVLKTLITFSSGWYYTIISPIESYAILNHKFIDAKIIILWLDRLGNPGCTVLHRIIENSHGHSLKNQKILLSNEISCTTCSQDKFVVRSSLSEIGFESLTFL